MADDEKDRAEGSASITRREWLLRFGGTAAAFPLSWTANQASLAKLNDLPTDPNPAPKALPAGLYAPSADHLTHALVADERFIPVPPGSPTDLVQRRNGPFHPQFFTPEEYKTVQQLVEVVLDAATSSTPGGPKALDNNTRDEIAEWLDDTVYCSADVREAAGQLSAQCRTLAIRIYGEPAVRELETADHQRNWREGLAWLAKTSHERYGKPFLVLDAGQQVALLSSISNRPAKQSEESAGTRFFALLKREVGNGYYTSQRGLEELGYPGYSFHAESPGCPKNGLAKVKDSPREGHP